MSAPVCTFESLVEARHDERLDERDAASVERHVATCSSCAALARDLERLGGLARRLDPAPSALEHRRRRMQLLQAAAAGAPGGGQRRSWAVGAALAAAAAAVVVGVASRQPPAVARLASVLSAPTFTEERTETKVTGSEGAVFSRLDDADVHVVELDEGSVHLEVRPLGPTERFVVRTDDAEVEVRGTVFDVSAETGLLRSVAVQEGKVEVLYAGRRTMVLAGTTWRAPAPPPSTSAASIPSAHRAATVTAVSPAPNAAVASDASGAPPRPADSSAFAEGVRQVGRGDYGAAAQTLDDFAKANPNDARAEDAAFLAAIALQRAGRKAEAAEAARRYLARYPDGFRRREAEAIASSP